jgi:hypothetical protein
VGNEAKDDQPSIVNQLKVVAHPSAPDKATRTFHLKASSDEQERLSITEEMVEMVASKMTEAAMPEISDKLADISDVFATPPASSEPPILPSDMDVEPTLSWPIIDSTLSTEEVPTQKAEPEIKKKKEAHILYELISDDGFYAQSNSLSAVWQKLLDAVQDARLAFKMEPLYNGCLKSVDERNLQLTGLHHHAIINLLEQLPNADCFSDYTFRYRANRDRESAEKLITGSTFGCVRAAPFNGRVPYDMFGWLASQYRPRPQLAVRQIADQEGQPPGRRVTNFELLPMTVRFKHLRQVAKNSVGVYRSHIHGRGLFCKRDIEVKNKKDSFCNYLTCYFNPSLVIYSVARWWSSMLDRSFVPFFAINGRKNTKRKEWAVTCSELTSKRWSTPRFTGMRPGSSITLARYVWPYFISLKWERTCLILSNT